MALKKINSIYFHQRNQVVKSMCQNHRIKQGVKKQQHLKEQVITQIFKQNKKAEQDQNPSHLKNLNIDCLKVTANYLPYLDQINLVSTCEELRGKTPVLQKDFNIDTIKNAFENEVNQFINLFKDNYGNFKHRNDIANEINNGTIMLPQDPFVLKEGFKVVFSNMDDAGITDLLYNIKDNISQNKLEELASIAINKMSDDYKIWTLLRDIKDNISQNKLEELASVAINKMTDGTIRALLRNIQDKISPNKLEELASVAIDKMSDVSFIRILLVDIKDNISPNKLEELVSMAFEKMSDDYEIWYLLEGIKDIISPNKLEELASGAIEKMTVDIEIGKLLVGIKDNISKDLYNKLKYNIYEKNILEQWKTNK